MLETRRARAHEQPRARRAFAARSRSGRSARHSSPAARRAPSLRLPSRARASATALPLMHERSCPRQTCSRTAASDSPRRRGDCARPRRPFSKRRGPRAALRSRASRPPDQRAPRARRPRRAARPATSARGTRSFLRLLTRRSGASRPRSRLSLFRSPSQLKRGPAPPSGPRTGHLNHRNRARRRAASGRSHLTRRHRGLRESRARYSRKNSSGHLGPAPRPSLA
mmetsp:Transcript_2729/g.8467  ORF Transcript_2729/g.8467 Transcript_2729/m.8467 type:complete len:225 (+) Transcript_2729:659-1333(+)